MTTADIRKHFPSLEPELVEELLQVASIKTYAEGEVIMRSGQQIRTAILLLEGLVKIYREDDNGNEFFMYYLDAGKACAISLVCALGVETSAVMARAVTECTIISVPVQHVNDWMGKYKSWAQFAVASYRDRFDELLQTIDHVAFRNMDERLVFYLKRQQEKLGTSLVTTSFTEMAQDLNSSREVISRLMKKLSEKGLVELRKNGVRLVDLDKALA